LGVEEQFQSRLLIRSHSAIRWTITLGLLLLVASVALYCPALHYPFTNLDDTGYVVENEHVKYGLDWDTVRWAFTTFDYTNWHPLTWLSHALDCHLYSLDAGKHHRTNVLLHAANVVLLFWVLVQATGYIGRSAMVAALFAMHPINVESVVWIAERKNLLSMMFFLLALGAYRWYASRPQFGRYVVVALLYAMGLMSKPQIVTFPFVVLLWDYWPLRRMFAGRDETSQTAQVVPGRSFSWLVLEKVPLFILSALSAVITLKAQRAGHGMNPSNAYPFVARLGNAVVSYLRYTGKTFWPSHLAVLYPHPAGSINTWQVVAGVLFLLVTTGLVIVARSRYLLVGWFWFLGTLVPMIGLVQVGAQAMADRYAYLPLVGLFIMVCWGVADVAAQLHISNAWLAAAGATALVALAVTAHRQIGVWKDNVTLWSHAVEVTSGNWIAEENLGATFLKLGRMDQAMAHFRRAAAIQPHDGQIFLYMGTGEQQRGNFQQALAQYQQVIIVTQGDIAHNTLLRYLAFTNMAEVYRDLGDTAHAQESIQAAKSLVREYGRKTGN
jgi:protein O-mannosyl-transferase